MSLLGGDAADDDIIAITSTQLSDESESLSDPTISPASSRESIRSPEDTQSTQRVDTLIDPDNEDDDEDENEDEDGKIEADENSRPNRFAGKPSTWKGYTAAERNLAASLDQLESGDLAAHLYNAHALKRRVRLPPSRLREVKNWHGKDQWMKKGEDLQYTDDLEGVQSELVPSKRWTSWPLPAERVAAPSERFGRRKPEEGGDGWVIGGLGEQRVGDELREEILANFLRLAKEKWEGKEAQEFTQDRADAGLKLRLRSQSGTIRAEQPSYSHDEEKDTTSDLEMQGSADLKLDENSAVQRKFGRIPGKRKSGAAVLPVKLALLADDDKARRILQPTINSLLTQVERLATAVHRTRMNHFGRGASSDTSGSEVMTDRDSKSPGPRSGSRSRSRSASLKRVGIQESSRATSIPKTGKPVRRRRKRSFYDSDSASDYARDHETENIIETGPSLNPASNRVRGKSRGLDTDDDSFMNREASVQTGLLDWSEILGLAAMTGWNERAVVRAAQRCSTLFGEGMAFRPFNEGLASKPMADPVHYTTATIPGPDMLGVSTACKRPFFAQSTLRCPHTDCFGHTKDFKIPYRVVEHVMRIHGYDPRTNDSDNEERKLGGVHTDGFLQPITAKQGWLGQGRPKSTDGKERWKKRNNMQRAESSPAAVEGLPT